MRRTKRKRTYTLEALDIVDVEHSVSDKSVEVVPTECWTLHMYDQFGNIKIFEMDKNLN